MALNAGTASGDSNPQTSNTPVTSPAFASHPPASKVPTVAPPVSYDVIAGQAEDVSPPETEDAVNGIEDTRASSSQIAVAGTTVSDSGSSYIWWFGAIGLAVVGSGAVLASRRAGKREWDIVEESTD